MFIQPRFTAQSRLCLLEPTKDFMEFFRAVVIAQIEDPEGVDACEEIAATDGIDGVFVGPADLSVAYGKTNQTSDELYAAMDRVGQAARGAGKGYMTFVPNPEGGKTLEKYGFHMWFVASEHAWMLQGARAAVAGLKG